MAERGLNQARAAASAAARASYGRLLSVIAAPTGDIPAAEDALSEAFVQALRTWPDNGVPDNPEGWLVTVARNRLRDLYKSPAHRTVALAPDSYRVAATIDELDLDAIPDKRLELLFVCAHPAIDAGTRTPLMLHTVLGFEAADIATAFALPTVTMAQRLVRAKRRIRDARIPFRVPVRQDMPARLPAVLEAIYGAYSIDWQSSKEHDSLAAESLFLALTLASQLDEPEAYGLAALISLSMSRAGARIVDGRTVPLESQDTSSWDASLIAQGEALLRRAHALGRTGRFQLEAAIQSVHCARAITGETDWVTVRTLHEGLVQLAPTLGARVSLAAVIGRIDGPAAGLAELDALDDFGDAARRFQPAWATRAHLLAEVSPEASRAAFDKAISLTTDSASRAYLQSVRPSLLDRD